MIRAPPLSTRTHTLCPYTTLCRAPEAGAAFPCSVVPGAVSRRQGQQVDQRAARQADLVAPLVAHDDVAAGGSPHAVAAEVVTLGRRPVELARLVVAAEQRPDALQGGFRVLHHGLVPARKSRVEGKS